MKILVTGGSGYIGSQTCVTLLNEGHEIVVVDNLINSDLKNIKAIETITQKNVIFHNIDATNEVELDKIFDTYKFDGVIHFASLKSINESIEIPIDYYYNNVISTLLVSKLCIKYNVNRFVFSSSATVYGHNSVPFTEGMDLLPTTNPYGTSKVMCEKILSDISKSNPVFSVIILRYFNPIGAHESGLLGESPNNIPNNIMPYITRVAKGTYSHLEIYGNDYNTFDGTGVRDYIHVVDIAEGHVIAIEKMKEGVEIYNLGTGVGTSVLQLVKAFELINGIAIPYKFVDRRKGDIDICYADVDAIHAKLGWRAKRGINEMVRDAWKFEKNCNS